MVFFLVGVLARPFCRARGSEVVVVVLVATWNSAQAAGAFVTVGHYAAHTFYINLFSQRRQQQQQQHKQQHNQQQQQQRQQPKAHACSGASSSCGVDVGLASLRLGLANASVYCLSSP